MPKNFEDRMVNHLYKCFSGPCKKIGELQVRKAIQHGIERTKKYGIISQRDICKYLNIMFVFGKDFDTNPNFSWARKILSNPSSHSPSWVIKDLYDAAIQNADDGQGYDSQ